MAQCALHDSTDATLTAAQNDAPSHSTGFVEHASDGSLLGKVVSTLDGAAVTLVTVVTVVFVVFVVTVVTVVVDVVSGAVPWGYDVML